MSNNDQEFNYMLLSRYQMDLDYYFGNGNRNDKHLYHDDINTHIDEMKKLWNSFADDMKPEWLTMSDIENYQSKI